MSWLMMLALQAHAELPTTVVDALHDELERNQAELTLPEAPELYLLRYWLNDYDSVTAEASFGALTYGETGVLHTLSAEVRVGSPAFDNTNYGGWENGTASGGLPDLPTPTSARQVAWRVTDVAYKDAVEQYGRKAAAFTPPEDYPGDLWEAKLDSALLGRASPPSQDRLEGLARSLSGALGQAMVDPAARCGGLEAPAETPLVEMAEVVVASETGSRWLLDSDEGRLQMAHAELTIRAMAQIRAADGMVLTDQRTWLVRTVDDLPSEAELLTEVQELGQCLAVLSGAEPFDGEYVGPVLFEDQAAVEFFRWLLVPQVEGTPPVIPFDTWLGAMGSGLPAGAVRMGRRVLPPGWSAFDDPQHDPDHAAAFSRDLEGVPAERVELVQDGIVKDVLLSRIPRQGFEQSNGHARGSAGSRLAGRVSQLTVHPPRQEREKALLKRGFKLASSYGHDYVLVVRRMQEDAVRVAGAVGSDAYGILFDGEDGTFSLPHPVALVKRYADGREVPVRGARFASVDRFALRDIQGAGPMQVASFFAPFESGEKLYAPTVGMPVRIEAPEVLVGELELLPTPGDVRSLPRLPPPPMQAQQPEQQ